jgi:hypothetical protein
MRISSNLNLNAVVQRRQTRDEQPQDEAQKQRDIKSTLPVRLPWSDKTDNNSQRAREMAGRRVARAEQSADASFNSIHDASHSSANMSMRQKRAVDIYSQNQQQKIDDGLGEFVGSIDIYV